MKRRMPLQQPLRLGYRSLPPSLVALKALQVIKLSNQGLNGSLPDAYGAVGAFPALEVLDVSFNRLSGRLPPLPGADVQNCPTRKHSILPESRHLLMMHTTRNSNIGQGRGGIGQG